MVGSVPKGTHCTCTSTMYMYYVHAYKMGIVGSHVILSEGGTWFGFNKFIAALSMTGSFFFVACFLSILGRSNLLGKHGSTSTTSQPYSMLIRCLRLPKKTWMVFIISTWLSQRLADADLIRLKGTSEDTACRLIKRSVLQTSSRCPPATYGWAIRLSPWTLPQKLFKPL